MTISLWEPRTECVDLKENVPHQVICFNTLSHIGRTIWEGLGGLGGLEINVSLGVGLEISKD